MPQKPNKYHAKRAQCDLGGVLHWHDSQKERLRHFVLHQRQERGEITGLTQQPRYALWAGGQGVGYFTADFWYRVVATGEPVVEDVKSPPTRRSEAYRLRKRIFEACWAPLTITEVE
jgi:hypothetical protein